MYKEKLIELLKTDVNVKNKIEQLKFGTLLKDKLNPSYSFPTKFITSYLNSDNKTNYQVERYSLGLLTENEFNERFEIIGNPLEERFIRIFCHHKGITINLLPNGELYLIKSMAINDKLVCKVDDNYNFENQSEEVYKKIYNTLLDLSK